MVGGISRTWKDVSKLAFNQPIGADVSSVAEMDMFLKHRL